MSEFGVRLRRVRMKTGGADVRVIRNEGPRDNGEDWRGTIVGHARSIADKATEEAPLAGFLIVGLFADGGTSTGFRYDPDLCPIPRVLLPTWAEEVVRRDVLMETEARGVFDEMFQWVE